MKRSSFVATLATVALSISAIVVGVTSANASITLPKGAFLPCSAGGGSYCIDSVSITPSGGKAIALTWVATGSQGSAAGNTNGVAAGKDLPGRWSADGAFTNENYDGLYVEAQAANEFVPWIVLDAKPTYSPGNKVSLAAMTTSATTPVNLNSDAVISVKMRISDFKLGVTYGIATEAIVDVQSGIFEIAGYPVKVPQAKNTKDCSGDAGVSSALVTQFQSILVPSNDPLGFSFEGGSGKIYVGSNGLCKLSTPVWNSEKKSLSYKASAPRLSPDGKTVNTGFYYATISSADALALWGLKKPEDAAAALIISVRTNEGGSTAATKTVAVKNGRIIIQVFGFEFPDPMLDISLNPSYDVLASSAQNASNMSAAGTVRATASPKPKTTTISCIKGNQLRKVTGVKPKCPTGFKKRS
jgi:hypothetical protein